MILPLDVNTAEGVTHTGLGAAEFGLGYRILDEDEDSWVPQVIVYPEIEVPMDNYGGEPVREFLPLWLQKSFGDWTAYAGGGYWNNPGRDNRDFWFFSAALLRDLTENFQLGAEFFYQTASEAGGKPGTGIAIGALYDFNEQFQLSASVDTGLTNRNETNQFSYYVALIWMPEGE